jgi:hypothetical protein
MKLYHTPHSPQIVRVVEVLEPDIFEKFVSSPVSDIEKYGKQIIET